MPLTLEHAEKIVREYEDIYLNEHEESKDMVNKPNHYIGINGIEVEKVLIGFIPRYEDSYVAHRVSSAIEYLLRSPLKNGLEDLKKAHKNIGQALEYLDDKEK